MVIDKPIIHPSYLPSNNTIGPGPTGGAKSPPSGYIRLPNPSTQVSSIAKKLLGGQFGTMTPIEIGTIKYMARVEPHYHEPPPSGADPSKYPKPWGWHKGVTVYQQGDNSVTKNTPSGRMKMLQRIDDFLNNIKI